MLLENGRLLKNCFVYGEINLKEKMISERYIANLLHILSVRDVETEEHTRRVTSMTLDFARLWNLPKERLADIRAGAQLHDIGKVGIPDSILFKKGPLTEEERAVIRMHPTYAYELLSRLYPYDTWKKACVAREYR